LYQGELKLLKLGKLAPVVGLVFAANFILIAFPKTVSAVEIVVNKSVPVTDFSSGELQAVFSMQKQHWSGQRQIKVFTLPETSSVHQDFVKHSLHMFGHQVRRIWDRMIYSGTGVPPVELSSEEEMIEKIANTPDAIGYLSSKPKNENIHVVSVH
jgi:ABC-type phosphate transport system substrate-binding protein